MRRSIAIILASMLALGACRSAVIVEPRDEATQTIVTVERRPATQPSDKGLIVRER
jgi:hypothetical protein